MKKNTKIFEMVDNVSGNKNIIIKTATDPWWSYFVLLWLLTFSVSIFFLNIITLDVEGKYYFWNLTNQFVERKSLLPQAKEKRKVKIWYLGKLEISFNNASNPYQMFGEKIQNIVCNGFSILHFDCDQRKGDKERKYRR